MSNNRKFPTQEAKAEAIAKAEAALAEARAGEVA